MNNLERLTKEFDTEMTRVYEEYVELHKQLNSHRGKQLEETNLPVVNDILKNIQEKFNELYPAYHFIAFRHQFVTNVVNDYNDFIDTIKKAGAVQDNGTKIITQ